jgi:hypothetical protein
MPIDSERQDEAGRLFARFVGSQPRAAFYGSAGDDSTSLRFIDPNGDTTFNQPQGKDLIAELIGPRGRRNDLDLLKMLDALINFVDHGRPSPHLPEIHW